MSMIPCKSGMSERVQASEQAWPRTHFTHGGRLAIHSAGDITRN
jgi:hypothetical protein